MITPTISVSATLSPGKKSVGGIERVVTGLITSWVVLVPWLMGGRFWWTQVLGAGVGLVAFLLAVSSGENRRALRRFPVFWLGLLFLCYVACQALNPWALAVQHRADILVWDLFLLKHVPWLPSGVSGNYFQMSTWRMFVYWLAPWLLVSAWWAAVRRRRSGRRLVIIIFLNGLLTLAVILVQRFYPSSILSWSFIDPYNPQLPAKPTSAAFYNWDHAGMFLYLSLGAGLAVAGRLMNRARAEGRDTGLAWVVLLGCLAIMASFFITGGRAGLVIACVYFPVGLILLILGAGAKSPGLWAGALVLVLGLAALLVYELHGNNSWTIERWEYLRTHEPEDTRAILRQETLRMIQPRLWLGWGAGSYRYVSPDYFREDYYFHNSSVPGGLSLYTDYAHNDWLQIPMEFGVVGASFVLGIVLYSVGYALWLGKRLRSEGWVVLLAAAALLVHALVDFPLYNTAVLALLCLLVTSTIKTASLDARPDTHR